MIPAGQRLTRIGKVSILWRPRSVAVGLILLALCLVVAMALLATGTASLTPGQVLGGLTGQGDDLTLTRVIRRIRLPRMLTAALVGAALGMSGAVFQSLSRNALGSPDVIGFTTGAATGAIVQIILFDAGAAGIAAAAVAAGLLTAVLVLMLARRGGGYRLILVGIGTGAVLTAVNTLLMTMGDLERAMSAHIWLAGSLSARNWTHVTLAASGLLVFAPVILAHARRLSLLEMGTDTAQQLGVASGRAQLMLVLAGVGLASVATAATGPIAFVALAAPQLARRLTRSPAVPVVTGAGMGALLLMLADLVSQRAPLGMSLPIGVMTALLGGAYLLLLLAGRR
ncbi:FecCD family ABC transporter permease [Neotabrizicola sp. VNH66]|uniref:FecCD family ABC transporter permease n=1 Tax=Neotabrizicola sp. VNH66 TaxID=3400918 RepID=UPI003C01EFB4